MEAGDKILEVMNSTITPNLTVIREAQKFLAVHFVATPLVAAPSLARWGAEVYLKLELTLPTGSFKPRGAIWGLAANLRKREIREVTASSTGNHGAAVAFAAKTLGLRATIFPPANPNPVKRKKIADLGAAIVEAGGTDLADACRQAMEYSARPGTYFLNDATDADLPAGLAQLPHVGTIFVPTGDTALIR